MPSHKIYKFCCNILDLLDFAFITTILYFYVHKKQIIHLVYKNTSQCNECMNVSDVFLHFSRECVRVCDKQHVSFVDINHNLAQP